MLIPSHTPCGFYRLAETTVFHYAGYECAAWWQDVLVAAGDYPVTLYKDATSNSLRFFVKLPGTIVADNFQSLWGGVPIGDAYNTGQNAGKLGSYHICTVDYCLFTEMKEKGESCPWHIDLAALPVELDRCIDCDCIHVKSRASRICPGCAVARDNVQRAHVRRRHRFLLSTGYGMRTTRNSSYLESIIASVKTGGIMSDFYREILVYEVAEMRAAGPVGRQEARKRYPIPSYVLPTS
jgi:hypothetical protein